MDRDSLTELTDEELLVWWRRRRNELAEELSDANEHIATLEGVIADKAEGNR